MAKLNIDTVIDVLKSQKLPDPTLLAIVKELNAALEDEKEDRQDNKGVKQKNKLVILMRGTPELAKLVSAGGFVIQVKDGDKTDTLYSRIQTASRSHNDSLKRNKNRVTTLGDALSLVKRKFSKVGEYMVKTKQPVEIQVMFDEKIV